MDLQYQPRTDCQPPDRTGEWQRISKARIIRFGTVRCLRERFAPGGQRSGRGERTARTGSIADTLNREHPLHFACAFTLMMMTGDAQAAEIGGV